MSNDNREALSLAMFNNVIANGQNAIKGIATANGVAAAALLAFIGHLWTEGEAASVRPLVYSFGSFFFGMFASLSASAGSYFSQRSCALFLQDLPDGDGPHPVDLTQYNHGDRWNVVTVTSASAALLAFLAGGLIALKVFLTVAP